MRQIRGKINWRGQVRWFQAVPAGVLEHEDDDDDDDDDGNGSEAPGVGARASALRYYLPSDTQLVTALGRLPA